MRRTYERALFGFVRFTDVVGGISSLVNVRVRMNVEQFDVIDPTFVKDLTGSEQAVWKVLHYLHSKGKVAGINPLRIRDDVRNMSEFADHGDLWIQERIEIKQRPDIDFQQPEDFPYSSIIVDVAHAYDRAFPKPYVYFVCNASLTAAFVIMGNTSKHWTKVEKFDNARQRKRTFYECPLKHTKFVRLK